MEKNNFKSKLHLACSKNEYPATLNHVWFKNGYAYATNGHIAIKQSLELHEFTDKTVENLEGKSIHADTFKELLRYDLIIAEKDHIEAYKENCIVKFRYSVVEDKFPDVNSLMKKRMLKKIEKVAINFNLINILDQIFISDFGNSFILEFYGNDKQIIVTSKNHGKEEQMAILMPVAISE